MKIGFSVALLASVFLYSLPGFAEPCNTGALPQPLLEKLRKMDYAGAEADTVTVVQGNPDSQEAQLNLAKVYINSAIRSVVNFDFEAMGIDPNKDGTYHEIDMDMLEKNATSEIVIEPGYGQKAEEQINLVLDRWPDNRSLLYCLTKIKFYSRDHKQFLKTLHRTAETFKDTEDETVGFFLNYAKEYFDHDQARKSAEVYETLLTVFPDNAPLLSSLGVSYLYTGRTMKAIKLFDQAHEQAPKDEIVIGNIAEVAMLTGDFEKAERFLKIKAKMFPDDTSIYFDLAMNAMHKGVKNSLPYWDTYFEKNATHPDGEQWVHAARVIQQSIKDDTLTVEEQLNMASQFTEGLKTPKYAIPIMTYLQQKDHADAAYPYQLSHAYDNGQYYDLEETALKETYRRLQNSPSKYMELSQSEILYNLARTSYAQDKYRESLDYLDKMKKNDKEKANTGYLYGLVYIRLGKLKDARSSLELCAKSSNEKSLRESCQAQLDRL